MRQRKVTTAAEIVANICYGTFNKDVLFLSDRPSAIFQGSKEQSLAYIDFTKNLQ